MREFESSKLVMMRCKQSFWVLSVIAIMFFVCSCGKPDRTAQEEIGALEENIIAITLKTQNDCLHRIVTNFKLLNSLIILFLCPELKFFIISLYNKNLLIYPAFYT